LGKALQRAPSLFKKISKLVAQINVLSSLARENNMELLRFLFLCKTYINCKNRLFEKTERFLDSDYQAAIDMRDQSRALELMEYFVGNFSGRSAVLALLHTELFLG
jgi:hypothetical protein